MNALLRHLQIRPHGDNLLTSSAAFWLFSARILVLAMAASEAVAWGRLGYVFGERSIGWVAAIAVGALIFVVVWMIDVSLITMDRAWSAHAAAILGESSRSIGRALRTASTIVLRIGLLAGSLYITAPYLAQVVFYKDIQRFIDGEAVANIDRTRRDVVGAMDRTLEASAARVAAGRQALATEVAGAGLSGRHGFGPTAQTLADALAKEERDHSALADDRLRRIQEYDALAKDWRRNRDVLGATYGVPLPQTSVLENTRALDELRRRPEYQSTELAVQAFLAFMFFGLLLLKLFEPASIRLYLSEVLQQELVRYRAGSFDAALPETERSTVWPSPMTPQRLYAFLANEWSRDHELRARYDRSLSRIRALTRGVGKFEMLRTHLEEEVEAARAAYDQACSVADEARQSLVELNSAIGIVGAGRTGCRRQLRRWHRESDGFDDPDSRLEQIRLTRTLRQELTSMNDRLDRLREHKPGEQLRLARALHDQKHWSRELASRRQQLDSLSSRIRDLHRETNELELRTESPRMTTGT